MHSTPVLMGRYDVKITGVGTLVLPRDWRSSLVEDGVVYVMPNLHERCLILLRKSALDDEIARLQTQMDDPNAKTTLKSITENAKLLQVDGRGRIVIPADQREFAGIGKMVSLVGNVRCVTVWATEALLADKDEETWECIVAAMNE